MGRRGPKSKYDQYIEEVRRLYTIEKKTDIEIGEKLSFTAQTISGWRLKSGIESRTACRRKSVMFEEVKDKLPLLWEESKQWDSIRKYDRGSATRVAEKLGVSDTTAQEWLSAIGLLPKRSNINDSSVGTEVVRLYVNSKLPIYEVAKRTHLSTDTVSSFLKKSGIKVLKSQERRSEEEKKEINRRVTELRQAHIPSESISILSSKESLEEYVKGKEFTALSLGRELGCSFEVIHRRLETYGLLHLLSRKNVSTGELEVSAFLKSCGVLFEKSRKLISPQEVDFYNAEYKFAIEYNGDYYHSEWFVGKNYHSEKSKFANEKGVFLYHISESEWTNEKKRKIIESQIKSLLGQTQQTIYARKCEVAELETAKEFLDENHLQGNSGSKVKLGLFHKGELVAVMTFSTPRYSKKYEWEITRFCIKKDMRVTGGASKLFSYFVNEYSPKSIVSYSDIAKTRGTTYERLGFKLDHISDPNYVWVNNGAVLPRYQTQMKNEVQVMKSRGFARVFDCGNRVFVWTNNSLEGVN